MLTVKIMKKLDSFVLDKEWKVNNGEIVTLFGPSGSGKSITLRSIAGLLTPDKGLIQLNDVCLFDSDKKISLKPQQRGLGYVPQSYGLFPHLSVLDNISFGIKNGDKEARRSKAMDLLKKFEVTNLAHRFPDEISGGQKQRVAITRALAANPEVLLLDEPFSAIDTSLRKTVREEIKYFLNQCHIPVVLVTHDYEDVNVLDTRVVEY